MKKEIITHIFKDLFFVSFVTYLVLFIMEWYKTGLVTNYFNINIALLICILSGIITALCFQKIDRLNIVKKIFYYLLIAVLSITFGIIIFNSFASRGRKEIIISMVAVIVMSISLVLIYKND
ncbi:hypothetical protein KKA15_00900 [Patescibacteria group bacterium]|nr:hypothetical protein [Patescibacteria group bacterium]